MKNIAVQVYAENFFSN